MCLTHWMLCYCVGYSSKYVSLLMDVSLTQTLQAITTSAWEMRRTSPWRCPLCLCMWKWRTTFQTHLQVSQVNVLKPKLEMVWTENAAGSQSGLVSQKKKPLFFLFPQMSLKLCPIPSAMSTWWSKEPISWLLSLWKREERRKVTKRCVFILISAEHIDFSFLMCGKLCAIKQFINKMRSRLLAYAVRILRSCRKRWSSFALVRGGFSNKTTNYLKTHSQHHCSRRWMVNHCLFPALILSKHFVWAIFHSQCLFDKVKCSHSRSSTAAVFNQVSSSIPPAGADTGFPLGGGFFKCDSVYFHYYS